MKRGFYLQSLICLLVASCSVHELDTKDTLTQGEKVYFATLESYARPDTKVFVDDNVKIHWDADDRISLFETTWNREFRFTGNSGDRDGYFSLVTDDFGSGNPIDFLCAVYPYRNSTNIDNNDVLTLTLPSKQTYREGSFGAGANTMVSVTKDDPLVFKNVGGYLVFSLYGDGVSVLSIKLEGRNEEPLSGEATMTPVIEAIPKITMAAEAGKSISLTSNKPVELGASKEDATEFWLVVPPTPFSKGFKLTVTGSDGKEFIKETEMELSVERNKVLRIAPLEVIFD